jgi:hypothetical protein
MEESAGAALRPDDARRDLLEGAGAIGDFLREELGLEGVTTRRAFHLCASRQIPAGKLGGGWVGSRRALRAHFEKLTSAGTAVT